MARDTKTVRDRFGYRQCDDFAAYLNYMARRGWHFKEFRSGLVFEMGEPENAVYAVEVFTDGTAHDMQPSYKAVNFGEYCEAAGWQLIDQRVKWCVLKQTREDAVPIFTDEERFENVKSVTYCGTGKLLWVEMLLLVFMIGAIWYSPKVYLFSPIRMIISIYWPLRFLQNLWQTIDFRRWCKDCEARLDRGESLHFRHARKKIMETTLLLLSTLTLLLYLALTFDVHPAVLLIFFAVMALLHTLPGRFRMDTDSSKLVSALSSSILIFFAIVLIVVSSYHDMKEPEQPVSISVFRPGETAVTVDLSQDTTPFGNKLSCYLYTLDDEVSYFVYESQYGWVLDVVWNQELRNAEILEYCTDAWDAVDAFRTMKGRYVIRYEDRILILRPGPEPLTSEQIEAVIAALKES